MERVYQTVVVEGSPSDPAIVDLWDDDMEETNLYYHVDVRLCTQTNVQTGTVRPIRRVTCTHGEPEG